MPTLIELQQAFIHSLQTDVLHLEPYLAHHPHLAPHQQLSIYQTNHRATLQNVIKAIYPTCHKLVGDDFFIGMMNTYIASTPSYSSDLNHYGDTFATFIAQFSATAMLPYLADVAKLEWAWHYAFSAPFSSSFDFQTLASLQETPQSIYFLLPPHATLLRSPYPLQSIWETNLDNYTGDRTVTLMENTQYYYLIWRCELERKIDALDAIEWQLLTWIQESLNFEVICEKFSSFYSNVNITDLLPSLISRLWISNILHPSSRD